MVSSRGESSPTNVAQTWTPSPFSSFMFQFGMRYFFGCGYRIRSLDQMPELGAVAVFLLTRASMLKPCGATVTIAGCGR